MTEDRRFVPGGGMSVLPRALGGTLEVMSTPGSGTTVTGSVPSGGDGAAGESAPAAPAVDRTT